MYRFEGKKISENFERLGYSAKYNSVVQNNQSLVQNFLLSFHPKFRDNFKFSIFENITKWFSKIRLFAYFCPFFDDFFWQRPRATFYVHFHKNFETYFERINSLLLGIRY